MNYFQTNHAIIKLVEERETYQEALRLFHRIFKCLKQKSELSADEKEWIEIMQRYIDPKTAA